MRGAVKEKKIPHGDNGQDPNLEHFIWSPGPLPLRSAAACFSEDEQIYRKLRFGVVLA